MRALRKFLAGLAAWTLFAAPALAAWPPTVVQLGTSTQTVGATSMDLTTTADAPVGSEVLIAVAFAGAISSPVVTDLSGNTYAVASTICTFNTTNKLYFFYGHVGTDLPATANGIHIAWTGSVKASAAAIDSTDIVASSPLDVQASCQTGTSTTGAPISPAVTTGLLAQNNELVVGAVGVVSGISAFSANSPFTTDGSTTVNNPNVLLGHHATTVGLSAGDTFAPSWTTSRVYGAGAWTFKGPSTGSVTAPSGLLTLGVGQR